MAGGADALPDETPHRRTTRLAADPLCQAKAIPCSSCRCAKRGSFELAWALFDESDARSLSQPGMCLTLIRNFGHALAPAATSTSRRSFDDWAGVPVPFAQVPRATVWRPVVYVETLARIYRPSLSWRLIASVADPVCVQSAGLARHVGRTRCVGSRFLGFTSASGPCSSRSRRGSIRS